MAEAAEQEILGELMSESQSPMERMSQRRAETRKRLADIEAGPEPIPVTGRIAERIKATEGLAEALEGVAAPSPMERIGARLEGRAPAAEAPKTSREALSQTQQLLGEALQERKDLSEESRQLIGEAQARAQEREEQMLARISKLEAAVPDISKVETRTLTDFLGSAPPPDLPGKDQVFKESLLASIPTVVGLLVGGNSGLAIANAGLKFNELIKADRDKEEKSRQEYLKLGLDARKAAIRSQLEAGQLAILAEKFGTASTGQVIDILEKVGGQDMNMLKLALGVNSQDRAESAKNIGTLFKNLFDAQEAFLSDIKADTSDPVARRLLSLKDRAKENTATLINGLKAIEIMRTALEGGQRTWTAFGDNDFTVGRGLFLETLPRLLTGAAITKEEEKRFNRLTPAPLDNLQGLISGGMNTIQRRKLDELEAVVKAKLVPFGFKPEDAPRLLELSGLKAERRVAPSKKPAQKKSTFDLNKAIMESIKSQIKGK